MNNGDPRCEYCHGTGGVMRNHKWHRCQCVRGTKQQRNWMSYFNSIGAKNPAPKPDAKDR